MTRGFGKGWQTPGLVVGRGCVCGGGLKGLWVPHRPCSPAPELRALRGDRFCGWRALVPVPGDLASPHLPGEWGATSLASRFALLASLLFTQHLPLGPLESVPVPELCQLQGRHPTPGTPRRRTHWGSFYSRWIWPFSAAVVICICRRPL